MAEASSLEYPKDFSGYQIFGRIGKGAFASVYKAICLVKNEHVAIKVIELENDDPQDDVFSKVMNESTVMLQLTHDNIVSSLACFNYQTEVWIVMPMLVASCADILKVSFPNGFDDERWIARIFKDVVAGLGYLHKQQMVHRDLKSGNILLDAQGVSRIADFGVSARLIEDLESKKRLTVTGTPCWMAPEVAEHAAGHDSKADIWSLGITCLELMTGKPPYHAFTAVKAMLKILNEDAPSVNKYVKKSTSKSFRQFVDGCLQKDPKKRKSAAQLEKCSFLNATNLIPHGDLAELLRVNQARNPYIKNVNADDIPESLQRNRDAENKKADPWIFTADHNTQVGNGKTLQDIVAQVHQTRIQVLDGQFVSVWNEGGWVLGQILSKEEKMTEVQLMDGTSKWLMGSNIKPHTLEDLFLACQGLFPDYRNASQGLTDVQFRRYLRENRDGEHIVAACADPKSEALVTTVLEKFITWNIRNPAPVAAPVNVAPAQPPPANASVNVSRFEVLSDDDK